MNRQWSLGEEVYRLTHQWPRIVAFFLIGCTLGGITSLLWPPTYHSAVRLHVSLNPYRSFSDSRFLALANPRYSNIDDYKNWQLSQLSSVVYLDEFIQGTLEQLREEDDYWKGVEASQLSDMLAVEWRTAGKWDLIANTPDAPRARQAVRAWSEVVVGRVSQAILTAQTTIQTDEELMLVIREQARTRLALNEFATTQEILQEWANNGSHLPENQPIDTLERWRLANLTARLAQFTPAWFEILDSQPAEDAPFEEYEVWIDFILTSIDSEIPLLEDRQDYLEAERARLADQLASQVDQSYGLSPNLVIKEVETLSTETSRPRGQLVLTGGISGFLSWIFIQIVSITRRVR